jgi:oligopeptide/dipeptide ABC transporter ATP-binding protein
MEQLLLSVEDLCISFNSDTKHVRTVDHVNFQVINEDFLGIVGESGCGKTLTALSIMRLLPPNTFYSGRLMFKGEDLMTNREEDMNGIRGNDISMIFQEPMTSLNPVFTVGNQIAEVLTRHRDLSRKDAMNETVELLRGVRIPSPEIRVKEYPHQLSGGMRQRVMIAMAIACGPSLLIADEPTTALDVTIQAQVLALLGELREEKRMSILFITHDLGIVAEYARRVEVMYAGRIVEEAMVKDIFQNPRHPYTVGLIESLPGKRGEKLRPIPGQVPLTDELPVGCKFSTRCRYVIEECHHREPVLLPAGSDGHLSRCIRSMEL